MSYRFMRMLVFFDPPNGIVQILTITEKQFSKIEYLTGEFYTDIINSDKRLVIL